MKLKKCCKTTFVHTFEYEKIKMKWTLRLVGPKQYLLGKFFQIVTPKVFSEIIVKIWGQGYFENLIFVVLNVNPSFVFLQNNFLKRQSVSAFLVLYLGVTKCVFPKIRNSVQALTKTLYKYGADRLRLTLLLPH